MRIGADYAAFFTFLFLFAAAAAAEIIWLRRAGWTTFGKAAAYVLLTDVIGFGIGSAVLLAATLVLFMMVMGADGTGGSSSDMAYIAVIAAAVVAAAAILLLLKRAGLSLFRIRDGRAAWIYSLTVSVIVPLVATVPPALLHWLLTRAP